ncbi:adenine phosphoribosyltransferase [Marivirga lumbricoides]|uniref:Adenine phosphoribosyltransferase n=1 Tax=Marivirga lumbricoides TaxID=1046115 RepID=A0A2T4DSA4_9BACT|nr:adenine phosphoribosyltransferase [Marivirga lumbricoides]GGC53586.1 adenine phosphoribosyltransferase [Marivirga lumbricoides]
MTVSEKLNQSIRDIPDFPKPGIIFKDITPVLSNPSLVKEIVDWFAEKAKEQDIDVIVGVESRGFLFGMLIAERLGIPFVPVRKEGKLPYKTVKHAYSLEYGSASMEIHEDALKPGQRVMIHDDLLATGGTAEAAAILVEKLGAVACNFTFLIELGFLEGRLKLKSHNESIHSIVSF